MRSFNTVEWVARLFLPAEAAGAYNDWHLVALTTLEPWTLALVAVALAVAVAFHIAFSKRLTLRRRAFFLALRLISAIVVFLAVLEPGIELRAVSRVRARVPLLVDVSRSMNLAAIDGTRGEAVARHIAESRERFAAIADRAIVEPVLFGERSRPVDEIPSPLACDDGETDIAKVVTDLSAQSTGRQLGAVIVYSDGIDTRGLTPALARKMAEDVGAPIYAIGFPRDAASSDLAIRRIIADEFAFVHNAVTFDVEIEARGFAMRTVAATLAQGGKVVQTKEVVLDGGVGRVSFEFTPRQIGKQIYEVSVPVQAGEAVPGNNAKGLVLEVMRDRIRILQVAGRPSWDERFLREYLERNPNVDLISFFILRSTTDQQKASQEELALIPFPVNELFTNELGSFDVVIYQNFSYRTYRMAPYLRNVRDYVLRGGSFLMIGGDESFEDGAYAATPIAEVLPVRLGGASRWDTSGEYRPRLTEDGRRHPITHIGEAGEPIDAAYARLPSLVGANASIGLLPGAKALLEHPSLPGNPPIVAVREVAAGRSMAIATDSTWFWRFVSVGEGGAGREFDRFWNNSLRWLIGDPELALVRMKADRSVVSLGDVVGVEVRVVGPDYRGLEGARVSLEVREPSSGKATRPSGEFTTGREGKVVASFGDLDAGIHVLHAEAWHEGQKVGVASEPVIVESADKEFQSPTPEPDILRALAEGSGGRYIDMSEAMPPLEIEDPRRVEVDRTKRVPIWDTFPAFAVVLFAFGVEWILRRRAGLS